MASLQDLAARLAIPGLPEWTGVAALIALLLVGLAYLLMPFSVFGVQGRLDALEAQLDEIRDEIRGLSIRMSDGPRRSAADDWVDPPRMRNPAMDDQRRRYYRITDFGRKVAGAEAERLQSLVSAAQAKKISFGARQLPGGS